MDYTSASLGSLMRGPLLHTPQGWICVLAAAAYLLLALAVTYFDVTIPIGKTVATTWIFCTSWPFITFLFYVKGNQPTFAASWPKAAYLALIAAGPLPYAYWRTFAE